MSLLERDPQLLLQQGNWLWDSDNVKHARLLLLSAILQKIWFCMRQDGKT